MIVAPPNGSFSYHGLLVLFETVLASPPNYRSGQARNSTRLKGHGLIYRMPRRLPWRKCMECIFHCTRRIIDDG
ncbi:hypothetical protein F5141DRAFT_229048 [Pisolithus sp. B1]|nr:hypothetical protein F5141DRAFT_229048 [Pisolithus sp. B1]